MKRSILILLLLLFCRITLISQINNNRDLNSGVVTTNGISKDNTFYTVDTNKMLKHTLIDKIWKTVEIKVPQVESIISVDIVNTDQKNMIIAIKNMQGINLFYSLDECNQWNLIPETPNKQIPVFEYFDIEASAIYFEVFPFSAKYIFHIKENKWDSISNGNNRIDIIKICNGKGYIRVFDNTENHNGKIASTDNGCISYQILDNINYSEVPFTSANKGVLEKLTIISSSLWCAQFWYDVDQGQNHKVYFSNDHGSTWKILLQSRIDEIVSNGNGNAFMFVSKGGVLNGELYKVSENGNKLCKSDFKQSIKAISLIGPESGLILTNEAQQNKSIGLKQFDENSFECDKKEVTITHEANIKRIELFPNPATDILVIQSQTNAGFCILNNLGQTIFTGTLINHEYALNIGEYATGIYFVRVGEELKKWIKK